MLTHLRFINVVYHCDVYTIKLEVFSAIFVLV